MENRIRFWDNYYWGPHADTESNSHLCTYNFFFLICFNKKRQDRQAPRQPSPKKLTKKLSYSVDHHLYNKDYNENVFHALTCTASYDY